MNVIGHFTLRSLKQNRKWTIVTIIGIIISTAMITAVSTFFASFMGLMQNETIANTGNWHATIANVGVKDLETVEKAGFVNNLMLSRNIGYALLNGSENKEKPYLFIKQYDAESSKNFPTTLISGRMPQNDSELVLSQSVQTNGGVTFQVGDKLTLPIGERLASDGSELSQTTPYQHAAPADEQTGTGASVSEKLVTESTKTYTVVGIIERPNFEPSSAPGYTAITYLNPDTLKADDTVNVSLLAKQLNHNFYDKVYALAQSIGRSKTDVSFNDQLLRYYGVVSGDSTQKTLYEFAAVLIAIIMIASISLIYNAFAISVSERTRQLGMLASVGATKRQKRQNVYFEGFLIGLVGIPAGILAGTAGMGITITALRPLMQSFMNLSTSGLHLVVSPISIIAAIVFSVLTIAISAWIPARRASKIMPIDAIRQSQEIKLTGKAVKTSRLTRALFGFEGEIALKNLKRSRRKYRATILSLIISLVLFLTVSSYANFARQASTATMYGINFDIAVNYYNTPLPETKAVNSKITVLALVKEATTMETSSGLLQMDGAQLTDMTKQFVQPNKQGNYEIGAELYGLDRASFETYAQSVGVNPTEYENPAKPKAILINYAQAASKGIHSAGQVVTIKPGQSLRLNSFDVGGGKQPVNVDFELGALTDKRPMGVLIQGFNPIAIVVSQEVFASLQAKVPSEMQSQSENLFLTTENSDELQKQIDSLTAHLSQGQAMSTNIAAQAKNESDALLFLGVFVYGFIILISLICIANIFNTISTNITLRRKEFAMLRSVGMTPQGFNKMIRFESIFYGLKALLYGLPISVAIAVLLYRFQEGTLDTAFSLPWVSYGVAIVLIFIIVASTMLYSSAKIRQENIVDALKEDK